MDDTVFNHQIEVETAALDKLIADMTEALKDTADTIQETFEKWSKSISEVTDAARVKDTEAVFTELINFLTNGVMSEEARAAEQQVREELANKQYDNDVEEAKAEKQERIENTEKSFEQKLQQAEDALNDYINRATEDYNRSRQDLYEYYRAAELGYDAELAFVDERTYGKSESEAYNDLYNAYASSVADARKYYENTKVGIGQWREAELDSIRQTYDRRIELLEQELANNKENLVVPNTVIAPSTDIPGSVYADYAAGAYSSLASGINLSTGTTADILKVIAGADGVPKISGDLSSIKVNVVDVTANVRTIANNTNTMVEQLNAIKDTITDPEINLKIEGEDLYSGLKRVGKVVIYH